MRNSGAELVCEGAGDHACEYMTSGTVAILGPVGRNFASGMSGGTVFLASAEAPRLGGTACVVASMTESDPDAECLRDLLRRHVVATSSKRARALLDDWPNALSQFLKL
ncbi:MAG: hypothetical protein GIW95_02225, partial [Candidatus Eremiobacteraeota bacterium]|nr:hypothetical protein [Candidatus Eremiobacteraeota bacterium]